MLHIIDLPILSGFRTIAGNLHDIHPHQTARPLVCAKRERVKDFGDGHQPGSPPSRHPTAVPAFASMEPSISEPISSSFRKLASVVVLIDLAQLRLSFRACPSFPHEPP